MERPEGRRFWEAQDIIDWIEKEAPDQPNGSRAAAVWWHCYRYTQMLTDDTTRHIAQALLDGVGPFTTEDVTIALQEWADGAGDVGAEAISREVDDEIEIDLMDFFKGDVYGGRGQGPNRDGEGDPQGESR